MERSGKRRSVESSEEHISLGGGQQGRLKGFRYTFSKCGICRVASCGGPYMPIIIVRFSMACKQATTRTTSNP